MAGRSSSDRRRQTEPMLSPPSEDRISTDEILHLILSNLSLKEAIRTSVLSPRWRNSWCTNPLISLFFPPKLSPDPEIYSSIVDSCLSACANNQRVESMSVHINSELDDSIYHRWIDFAKDKSVRLLSLFFQHPGAYKNSADFDEEDRYEFCMLEVPVKIFSLSSLKFLRLHQCEIPSYDFDAKPTFPNLETLSLSSVVISKDTFSGLISTSPQLKQLEFFCLDCEDESIVISCPTLETLNLIMDPSADNCRVEILEVPKLRTLRLCCDLENVVMAGLNDSREFNEVTMSCNAENEFEQLEPWLKLVSSIRGAKTLTVDYWLLQDFGFGSPVFFNLRYLEICGGPFANTWFPAVVCLLKECPLLEKLDFERNHSDAGSIELTPHSCDRKFIADTYDFENDEIIQEFKDCTNSMRNLKTMKISGHYGFINLIKLMFFIATHADKLERVDIYTDEWIRASLKDDYIAMTTRGFNKLLEFKWINPDVIINIEYVEGIPV